MSDYLKRRFPLESTSTVYMSGRAVYNLVRWSEPGIVASVELLPADADAFRDAVRGAMAEAWDEGYRQSCADHKGYGGCTVGDHGQHNINPYAGGGGGE